MKILDGASHFLRKVMDLRMQNQQIIASNIANAETPGFASSRLDFEKSLKQVSAGDSTGLEITHPAHLSASGIGDGMQVEVIRTPGPRIGDRNGVELDREMVDMAENQILYEAAAQMLQRRLGILKYVTQETR